MSKLFVGNLNWSTTVDELKDLFAPFGEVLDAFIVKDRVTHRSKGFAFVTMENEDSAEKAKAELNNTEFKGRNIIVNDARPSNRE